MSAANDRKVILVTRKTRLEELIARYLTAAQARFYVEHLGADFSDYQREHDVYLQQRHLAVQTLEQWGRYQIIERGFLPNFIFGPSDIVVALGQDGVVANTMKYLDGQPLIGLNPDSRRHDGVLLPFAAGDLPALLKEVAADTRPFKTVTMAKVALANGQALHAVNDLFIGARTHTSALYEIAIAGLRETQSSSGLIVATGLGSTAWLKSIVTGSLAIAGAFGGTHDAAPDSPLPYSTEPHSAQPYSGQPWDASELQFAVREPFPSRSSQTSLVYGRLTKSQQLSVRSLMPENGVIFSDGIEADRLDFNSGTEAQITLAARQGRLIV
jgi:NAD kinase